MLIGQEDSQPEIGGANDDQVGPTLGVSTSRTGDVMLQELPYRYVFTIPWYNTLIHIRYSIIRRALQALLYVVLVILAHILYILY